MSASEDESSYDSCDDYSDPTWVPAHTQKRKRKTSTYLNRRCTYKKVHIRIHSPETTTDTTPEVLVMVPEKIDHPVEVVLKRCVVCATEESDTLPMILCGDAHATCSNCVHTLLSMSLDRPFAELTTEETDESTFKVKCFNPDCTSCFATSTFTRFISDLDLDRWITANKLLAVHSAKPRIIKDHMEKTQEEQQLEEVRNAYRLPNGDYSAYMCPECSYGPKDLLECNDLTAHHGQVIQQNGADFIVNNGCDKCGFFTAHIFQWNLWDGNFQSPPVQPVAPRTETVVTEHHQQLFGSRPSSPSRASHDRENYENEYHEDEDHDDDAQQYAVSRIVSIAIGHGMNITDEFRQACRSAWTRGISDEILYSDTLAAFWDTRDF